MSKIIAKGDFLGAENTFEITLEGNELIVACKSMKMSGKMQSIVEKRLKKCIEAMGPIGGTYYPPQNTLLAAYVGLQNGFFLGKANLEVEGELEPIPYEEGMIY